MDNAPSGLRPVPWLAELAKIKPADFPVGHSLRAGLSVGVPFVVGSVAGDVVTGMWIGIACLLLAAGERDGSFRANFRIIAVSTPIAASGYLLGFVQSIPLAALVVLMAVVAFAVGLIAGWGAAFSVGGMQFLLVAAIAIGVEDIDDWWRPMWLYFVGAAIYAALLAVEMLISPRGREQVALVRLITSLADLAQARADDLDAGVEEDKDETEDARWRATASYNQAISHVVRFRRSPWGRVPGIGLDAAVLSRADSVLALLVSETDRDLAVTARGRLMELARLAHAGGRGVRSHPPVVHRVGGGCDDGSLLLGRVESLSAAVSAAGVGPVPGGRSAADASGVRNRYGRNRAQAALMPGHEVTMAAIRLSLCIGIAVGAKWYFPFSHWFWVPLTVCLVMKPDFGSVFDRAILRVFGTVVGAAIATFVILLVPKGAWIGVAIGVLSALVPWFMARSYALQAVAIAPAVILLVDMISPGDGSANYSWQRIGATLVGGVIVIVFGYLVWPRSRRASTEASVGAAVGHIADQLLAAGTPVDAGDRDGAGRRHEQIVSARRAAYSGLADARARLQRALGEPPPACDVASSWLPVVEAADRLADAVTAYAGARLEGRAPEDPAGTSALAERLRMLVGDRAGQAKSAVPAADVPAAHVPATHVPEPLDAVATEIAHLQRLLTLEPIRA